MGSAVNTIEASALESLEEVNHRLKDGGITFHLSDVKGPVMDQLKRSHFLEELTGKVPLPNMMLCTASIPGWRSARSRRRDPVR